MKEELEPQILKLIDKMLGGDNLSLGRLINMVEGSGDDVPKIMKQVHPHTGKAYRVGITGPPGIGKSTLVDKLTEAFRSKDLKVGVIAVDPTSPFSGGAILGDRVRMQQHYLDKGVFIRSMATRGNLGGLPKTVGEVSNVIDASGKDIILIETVGVGQTELDIIKNVDTVVVVLAPGYGDTIQTMKAGLLEIADVFVINKTDQTGADDLIREIMSMLLLREEKIKWEIPVVGTQAVNNVGIKELHQQIQAHHKTLDDTGMFNQRRKEQRWEQFVQIIEQKLSAELYSIIEKDGELTRHISEVQEGILDPYSAAEKVLSSDALLRHLSQYLTPEKQRHLSAGKSPP